MSSFLPSVPRAQIQSSLDGASTRQSSCAQIVQAAQHANCDILNQHTETLRRKAAIVHRFLRARGVRASALPASQARQAFASSLRRLRRLTYLTAVDEQSDSWQALLATGKLPRGARPELRNLRQIGKPLIVSDAQWHARFPRYRAWLRRKLRQELYRSEGGQCLRRRAAEAMGVYAVLMQEDQLFDMLDMPSRPQQHMLKRLELACEEAATGGCQSGQALQELVG